jgi:hypothetical protein
MRGVERKMLPPADEQLSEKALITAFKITRQGTFIWTEYIMTCHG